MNKICPTCNNGFKGRKESVFCSMHCYHIVQKGISINVGENNGQWKGDNVKQKCMHNWVRRRKPKPGLCEECALRPPRDLANISQEYKRDINDYRWLCRPCHKKQHDIIEGRITRKGCEYCGNTFQIKTCLDSVQRFCSRDCFSKSRRYLPEKVCQICGKSYYAKPGEGKFCSMACYTQSRENKVELICLTCNKPFLTVPAYVKNGRKFCSMQCFRRYKIQ